MINTLLRGLGVLAVGLALAFAAPAGEEGAKPADPPVEKKKEVKAQTTCPVEGGKIDRAVFKEYDGKRVYFCCNGCPAEFRKAPAKYISQLEKEGVTLDRVPATDPTKKQTTGAADTVQAKDQSNSAATGHGGCCK